MVASTLRVLEAGEDAAVGASLREIDFGRWFGGLEEGSWQLYETVILAIDFEMLR